MATFTMELYKAIEVSPEGNIGLDIYPIWDDAYREQLNTKIINHYHSQEIGHETVDMFAFAMRRRMAEVMPYYNDLYRTTQLEFDPLSTMDIHTVTAGTGETIAAASSENTSETNSKGNSRAVNSTMPQVQLSGRGDYATSAADTNSENTGEGSGADSSNSTTSDTTAGDSRTSGYQGVAADILMRYRDTLLNIDLMIISELSDLFMMIWGNSDDYSNPALTRFDAI